jgi:hypothetical protein
MPEDLIALVTKEPVFRWDPADLHIGHRIEESWYACIDLFVQLARPYRARGYQIEIISHAQNPYGLSESDIKKGHPFMGIRKDDLIVLLHTGRYTIEKRLDPDETVFAPGGHIHGREYDHLALEDAARHTYVEVSPSYIQVLTSEFIVMGFFAEQIQRALRDQGHTTVRRFYFNK